MLIEAMRLPNKNELESLVDVRWFDPAICNTAGTGKWTANDPFINVQAISSPFYWTSTTRVENTGMAFYVIVGSGMLNCEAITAALYVWPVRGGPQDRLGRLWSTGYRTPFSGTCRSRRLQGRNDLPQIFFRDTHSLGNVPQADRALPPVESQVHREPKPIPSFCGYFHTAPSTPRKTGMTASHSSDPNPVFVAEGGPNKQGESIIGHNARRTCYPHQSRRTRFHAASRCADIFRGQVVKTMLFAQILFDRPKLRRIPVEMKRALIEFGQDPTPPQPITMTCARRSFSRASGPTSLKPALRIFHAGKMIYFHIDFSTGSYARSFVLSDGVMNQVAMRTQSPTVSIQDRAWLHLVALIVSPGGKQVCCNCSCVNRARK